MGRCCKSKTKQTSLFKFLLRWGRTYLSSLFVPLVRPNCTVELFLRKPSPSSSTRTLRGGPLSTAALNPSLFAFTRVFHKNHLQVKIFFRNFVNQRFTTFPRVKLSPNTKLKWRAIFAASSSKMEHIFVNHPNFTQLSTIRSLKARMMIPE